MHHRDPRQLRLLRRHKRNKPASIMLTSMIDIFTVLVFFLIVNSQNQIRLPNNQTMQVPHSSAQDAPKETLTIQISPTDVFVDTVHIDSVAQILKNDQSLGHIPALAHELQYRSQRQRSQHQPDRVHDIYILADRHINYQLLRMIMVTCSESDFNHISFAVERLKTGGKS